MRSSYRTVLAAVFCIVAAIVYSGGSIAQVVIPERPGQRVVDLAGIINDDMEASLNRYLLELEQKTTAQFAILTLQSLEGEPLEDLSIRIAHDTWKLGQKGKDNGVLLLVALKDREYRFEVGYGLEGILPDSLVGSIGRQHLVPYFREGDYSLGIFAASLAVIDVIAADAGVEISGMPEMQRRTAPPAGFLSLFPLLVFLAILFRIILSGGGRRNYWYGHGGYGGFGGRGWSNWGGGGGFGNGHGGFGGGGGGFGGGGASGRW